MLTSKLLAPSNICLTIYELDKKVLLKMKPDCVESSVNEQYLMLQHNKVRCKYNCQHLPP